MSGHDHKHGHGHGHGHDPNHGHGGHGHHHHVDPESGDRNVALAVGVNLLLTVAQIVGGVVSGSLSLIADAIHNLSDALSLGIAFGARRLARRPADAEMTFGYARAEVVAALVNYTTLIVIGLYLIAEGVGRLFDPPGIDGWVVVIVAGVALVIDLATAALTLRLSRESVNIRAAFVHNLSDALGSVAVIVAGTLVLLFGWRLVDPLVTLGIAGYILWLSFSEIGPVLRILMLGSPGQPEAEAVIARMEAVEAVENVHHLHLWQMDEKHTSLEAHVVVAAEALPRLSRIKAELREALAAEFGIGHVTLDVEPAGEGCEAPARIGGGEA